MKRIAIIFAALAVSFAGKAELRLPSHFSDSMVLQQKSDAAIWGWASEGAGISVKFNGKTYKTKAGEDGRWEVKVATPEASYTAYQVKISGDGQTITLDDVLVGEVWIASGQSNMEMPMRGFFNCPVAGSAAEYARRPNRNGIRMYTALVNRSYEPLDDIPEGRFIAWRGADSNTIKEMSATAYFFARQLNETLDIPIGIVAIPYGGARVESWLPEATVRSYGTESLTREAIEKLPEYHRPFVMYNAMEQPVKGYTAKGFIWYQGCSNVGKDKEFVPRMTDLISQWREDWGNAEMPFYMCEIAPYNYGAADDYSDAALLRQAQHTVAHTVANCGCIVTNDLVASYERDNVHPCRKKEVGERLALLALNRNYGCYNLPCDSPEAISMEKVGDELRVQLSNCEFNGLDRWMEIQGLEVCGSDGIWKPVETAMYIWEGKFLKIGTEGIDGACQVRYGWGDFKPGNLHNADGLAVAPFWLKL